jgi:hypothetical protein
MAAFFVPRAAGLETAESAHQALREQAEAYTGSSSSDRRIEQVDCRRSGRDCTLRVGEADSANGRTVTAIIQLARGICAVHHMPEQPGEPLKPTVLQKKEIYSIREFR